MIRDLARDQKIKIPTLPLHLCNTRTSGGRLEGIFGVKFTQLIPMSLYGCTHQENVFYYN